MIGGGGEGGGGEGGGGFVGGGGGGGAGGVTVAMLAVYAFVGIEGMSVAILLSTLA